MDDNLQILWNSSTVKERNRMKIYKRSDFMKLPEGTIFTSGMPFGFGNFCIKGESWEVDFIYSGMLWIEAEGSDDAAEKMDEMLIKGTSAPIHTSYCREGLFDDEMVYMVYEKGDLEYMIERFKEAIKLND